MFVKQREGRLAKRWTPGSGDGEVYDGVFVLLLAGTGWDQLIVPLLLGSTYLLLFGHF